MINYFSLHGIVLFLVDIKFFCLVAQFFISRYQTLVFLFQLLEALVMLLPQALNLIILECSIPSSLSTLIPTLKVLHYVLFEGSDPLI